MEGAKPSRESLREVKREYRRRRRAERARSRPPKPRHDGIPTATPSGPRTKVDPLDPRDRLVGGGGCLDNTNEL